MSESNEASTPEIEMPEIEIAESKGSDNKDNKKLDSATLGLMSLLVTTLLGMIYWVLNTWIHLAVDPNKSLKEAEARGFQSRRADFYANLAGNWSKMRVQYYNFITECLDNRNNAITHNATSNQAVLANTYASLNNLTYYFGSSIVKMVVYDIEWYYQHTSKCPEIDMRKELALRQKTLSELMLRKMYNPDAEEPNHNNPDFLEAFIDTK